MQVWLGSRDGDGMPVELLEPWAVEQNDFLARVVGRHGAGPHHLTVKVKIVAPALELVRAAGMTAGDVDTSDPEWKEGVVIPNAADGTVVHPEEAHGHP